MPNKKINLTKEYDSREKLHNYFQDLNQPSYGEMEVADLKDIYNQTHYSVCDDISQLLDATYDFLCATTLEDYFKTIRDQSITHDDLLNTLNEIGHAIQEAQHKNNQSRDDLTAQLVFSDALTYCTYCVKQHLAELESVNDRIYDLYSHEKNNLRDMLELGAKRK